MRWFARLAIAGVLLVAGAQILAFAFNVGVRSDHPPVGAVQRGVRGTGLVHLYNPRTVDTLASLNQVPPSVPYAGGEGPKAGAVYANVKVLGDVSAGEFTRLMVNMTSWVAPKEGCAGCHNVNDFADDSRYTKIVARRMLEMTQRINTDWTAHVAQTGVTCYTCHRGQLVPPNVWFDKGDSRPAIGMAQMPAGQNHPAPVVGGSSLPADPFTPFLAKDTDIRIQSTTALPADNRHSIKQTEWTYALMMHFSQALGVNCSYCHNTRAFANWPESSPQRVTAWHGIRMVRDLNKEYLEPLKPILPPGRLGADLADAPKANCATCHNGVYKPLFGVSPVQTFPELKRASAQ